MLKIRGKRILSLLLVAAVMIGLLTVGAAGQMTSWKQDGVTADTAYQLDGANVLIFKQSTYAVVWSARELADDEKEIVKSLDNSNIEQWGFTTDACFVLSEVLGNAGNGNNLATEITIDPASGTFFFTKGSISHIVWIILPDTEPEPEPEYGSLTIQKTIIGLEEGDTVTPTFTVTDSNGNTVQTVSYSEMTNGTYTWENLIPGEYTVTESDTVVSGYTCTATSDPADGKVTVVADNTASVKFTNTYTKDEENPTPPQSVNAIIEAKKEIKQGGNVAAPAEKFNFEVVDGSGNVVANAESSGGTFSFAPITCTEEGTYTYTVQEVQGDAANWSYDDAVYTVTVTVTKDSDNNLKAVVTYPDNGIVFTNTYTKDEENPTPPQSVDAIIEAKKEIEQGGNVAAPAEKFNFEVVDGSGNVVANAESSGGTFSFAPITCTEEGTYIYTVQEVQGTAANWSYDDTVYEVTVTVTEDNDGNLKAQVEYPAEGIVFTNTYTRNTGSTVTPPTDPTPDPDPDEEVEITDPETPLGPGPEEEVEIPAEETPLAPAPEEETVIEEEETPLAAVPTLPQTGASGMELDTAMIVGMLVLAAALTAAGITVIMANGKKEQD